MTPLACARSLGLLVACSADRSDEDTGSGAAGTHTTGVGTDTAASGFATGSCGAAPSRTSSTGAPDLMSAGDEPGCLPVVAGGVCATA